MGDISWSFQHLYRLFIYLNGNQNIFSLLHCPPSLIVIDYWGLFSKGQSSWILKLIMYLNLEPHKCLHCVVLRQVDNLSLSLPSLYGKEQWHFRKLHFHHEILSSSDDCHVDYFFKSYL